jgi:hypothetical protein
MKLICLINPRLQSIRSDPLADLINLQRLIQACKASKEASMGVAMITRSV